MADKVEAPAVGAQAAPAKPIRRRGISNETVGTTRLRFSHTDAKQNGLFLAHLEDVQLTTVDIKEDSAGMPSFRGIELNRLVLTFASNEEDKSKRRYQTLSFMPVESNVNTIPGGKEEWKVTRIFNYLKHILDVYVLRGSAMTPEMEDALALNFEDFDEQGEYSQVAPETVAIGWNKLFANFYQLFSTAKDGAPAWKTKDGKFITVWLKLIRYIKSGQKGWTEVDRGNLSFPTYPGEGVIEIFVQNTPPTIKLDATREAIRPMNIEKNKKPNLQIPGAMAGGVDMGAGFTGGQGSEMGGMADYGFGGGAIEDMPADIF